MQTVPYERQSLVWRQVVNLYAFEETVKAGKSFEVCVENIDIGGLTLVRRAAAWFDWRLD
jgi:AICAR transformylase/IMP cyclohydrolase PurH